MEYELSQHYNILRQYLKGGSNSSQRPNKARDKLLRLTPVQFHELSTDVFDELQRRQALAPLPGRPAQRRENIPPFLQPRRDFHEKRNQARQKLSSLQTSRFRDLSTDVFQELERRFPHFADPAIRPGSRNGSRGPGSQSGFVPPPRGASHGQSGSVNHPGWSYQRNGSISNTQAYDGSEYGRPMPKQFQSNTVMPNKSTMVEDDDSAYGAFDRSSDAFGLENSLPGPYSNRDTNGTSRSGNSSQRDVKAMEAAQGEMQQRIDELELGMKSKDDELRRVETRSRAEHSDELVNLRRDLQKKVDDAEHLNQSLRDELDRLHSEQGHVERDLRSQLEAAKSSGSDGGGGWRFKHDQLLQKHQELQTQMEQQRHTVEEVRHQATEYLNEMRAMADGSGSNFEREEKLHHDVQRLEEELKEWKARYAKTKTQLRNARASSLGLSISRPDAGRATRDEAFRHEQGLVKDVHITKFQIAIDELLRVARSGESSAVLEHMKAVVIAVRSITGDVDAAGPVNKDEEVAKRRIKLKAKVSNTANNVITACKNFATAGGISPVSLLDAAASHLTTAVVDLVRTVKIRPTPPGELDDDDDGSLEPIPTNGYFKVTNAMSRRSAAAESVYSALSTPTAETNGIHIHASGPGPSVHSRSTSRSIVGLDGVAGGQHGPRGIQQQARDPELEELKNYLESQTEHLVESIQSLVNAIRLEEKLPIVRNYLTYIADVVDNVVSATEGSWEEDDVDGEGQQQGGAAFASRLRLKAEGSVRILEGCKKRLLMMGVESRGLEGVGRQSANNNNAAGGAGPSDPMAVREFCGRLPPLAFEVARETKRLVGIVENLDQMAAGDDGDEENDMINGYAEDAGSMRADSRYDSRGPSAAGERRLESGASGRLMTMNTTSNDNHNAGNINTGLGPNNHGAINNGSTRLSTNTMTTNMTTTRRGMKSMVVNGIRAGMNSAASNHSVYSNSTSGHGGVGGYDVDGRGSSRMEYDHNNGPGEEDYS